MSCDITLDLYFDFLNPRGIYQQTASSFSYTSEADRESVIKVI